MKEYWKISGINGRTDSTMDEPSDFHGGDKAVDYYKKNQKKDIRQGRIRSVRSVLIPLAFINEAILKGVQLFTAFRGRICGLLFLGCELFSIGQTYFDYVDSNYTEMLWKSEYWYDSLSMGFFYSIPIIAVFLLLQWTFLYFFSTFNLPYMDNVMIGKWQKQAGNGIITNGYMEYMERKGKRVRFYEDHDHVGVFFTNDTIYYDGDAREKPYIYIQ